MDDSAFRQAIRAAVLNITVTESLATGFVTVYPCDTPRPLASTLNYGHRQHRRQPGHRHDDRQDGKVCIYTQRPTHLIVDLSGYHT